MRSEFGNRTVHEVVSGERDKIMATVADKVDADVKGIGVEVVDVPEQDLPLDADHPTGFRRILALMSVQIFYEAARDLPYEKKPITAPFAVAQCNRINKSVALVPLLSIASATGRPAVAAMSASSASRTFRREMTRAVAARIVPS